ncbi:MAG: TetR family transcriptional regulator C-terminal domain-containing protein [Rhizobiaceae bacterium]
MVAAKKPRTKAPLHSDTRAHLLMIGTEILSEKGFFSTGVEEVLSKAGVPKGSFYYYFDSKAAFGFAVVENYEKLWAQKLTRLLCDAAVAPLERIHNYISEGGRGLEKYNYRRGCLVGNIGQEMNLLDEQFRERILSIFASWGEFIRKCLKEARERGDVPSDLDIEEVSRFFWLAWEGAILQAKLEHSTRPIEEFRSVLFKLILRKE